MTKEKRLSAGIQKFLEDKKKEEEEQAELARRKKSELVARRDPKEQRKIDKSLKVIKSSKKFYTGDSTLDENTAVTLENQQPDDDDYGYSSAVSDMFHKKLMEKYQTLPEDKKFSSRGRNKAMTKEEMNRAKDRMKDAFVTKDEDQPSTRQPSHHRTSRINNNKVIPAGSGLTKAEESKKNFLKPKPKLKAAPIVDFQQLLKLAEQKQHEDIKIDVPTKKEPERLLTSKEKREQEEIEAARRARMKPNRIPRLGAIPKLGESSKNDRNNNENTAKKPGVAPKPSTSQQRPTQGASERSQKPATSSMSQSSSSKLRDALQPQNGTPLKPSSHKVPVSSSQPKPSSSPSKQPSKSATNGQRPANGADKYRPSTSSKAPEKPRQFPPKDLLRSREFPPKDLMRGREFPPRDLMRSREFPPRDMKRPKPLQVSKRKNSSNFLKLHTFTLLDFFQVASRMKTVNMTPKWMTSSMTRTSKEITRVKLRKSSDMTSRGKP